MSNETTTFTVLLMQLVNHDPQLRSDIYAARDDFFEWVRNTNAARAGNDLGRMMHAEDVFKKLRDNPSSGTDRRFSVEREWLHRWERDEVTTNAVREWFNEKGWNRW